MSSIGTPSCALPSGEAARHLFVSPHTVDFHLRHTYRKLGITSRLQLAVALTKR